MKNYWKHSWLGHLTAKKDKSGSSPKKSIPGQHLWRILGSLVISQGILLSAPAFADSAPNTMSYSQLIDKIEKGQVSKIEIDELQRTARVRLEGQKSTEPTQIVTLFDYNNRELYAQIRANKEIDFEVKQNTRQQCRRQFSCKLASNFRSAGGADGNPAPIDPIPRKCHEFRQIPSSIPDGSQNRGDVRRRSRYRRS